MRIMLNPAYVLKPDMGRVLLLEKQGVRMNILNEEGFNRFIHPVFAIILNCMDGSEMRTSAKEAAELLNVTNSLVLNFIEKLVHNEERVVLHFEKINYVFPKNCLIIANEEFKNRKKFDYELFLYDKLDLRNKRHHTPTDITLMVNTICETDCFYCYADRRIKMNCKIPFEKIKDIIKEAYSLHVRTINVIGGEFFLYKKWEDLLLLFKKYDYFPFLSTKVPLDRAKILKLKNVGVMDIQISLDSLIPENLTKILKVNESYASRIKETLSILKEYNFEIIIHTIITSENQTIEDLESIYEFIKDFENLKSWRIDLAESSLYHKNKFDIFKPKKENIDTLYDYVRNLNSKIRINYDGIMPKNNSNENKTYQEKLSEFNNRAICSANLSHMFILPDGKVTTCEEFYWDPQFIIGDILKESLWEIWNSDRSKYLYMIPQNDIPKDSPCSICEDYYSCRQFVQTCVRDTMKVYGKDKWYYPDIRCPKAPPLKESEMIRV